MKLDNLVTPPKGYESTEAHLMSNFDHVVDKDVEKILRTSKTVGDYSAAGFHGDVWFQDGKFRAFIMRYHQYQGTWEADTPEELMTELSNIFGHA